LLQAQLDGGVSFTAISEVEYPGCSQPLAIGPTARVVVCANCGERVPVKRVGERPSARAED